jgi:hypothetical protein
LFIAFTPHEGTTWRVTAVWIGTWVDLLSATRRNVTQAAIEIAFGGHTGS